MCIRSVSAGPKSEAHREHVHDGLAHPMPPPTGLVPPSTYVQSPRKAHTCGQTPPVLAMESGKSLCRTSHNNICKRAEPQNSIGFASTNSEGAYLILLFRKDPRHPNPSAQHVRVRARCAVLFAG